MDLEQYFLSKYSFLTLEDVQEFMQIGVQKDYEPGDEFIRLGEKRKKIGTFVVYKSRFKCKY